ncbi:MAG: hypothetical protein QG641_3018 [Candidatus Poribacteria bacterium]|nr:hypothetical protein [Euryarchaeota archaeon]MDQ1329726.1 hypothetical protein [Candidatus Poribacteria bacterium]
MSTIPSDVPNTASLQAGIEKLIQIGHSATDLCCKIQEIIATLTGATDSEVFAADDPGVTNKLTSAELMEIVNLETTRQALMKSWRYVEGRKANIIRQATNRIDQQGAEQ